MYIAKHFLTGRRIFGVKSVRVGSIFLHFGTPPTGCLRSRGEKLSDLYRMQPPSEYPSSSSSAAPQPPWWKWRRWGVNFLVVSIVVHLLFLGAAAKYIVQIFGPKPKQTFTAAGHQSPTAVSRVIEHKVSLARQQSSASAPVAVKRVTTTSASKSALPAMPAMPQIDSPIAPLAAMSGMGGLGTGMTGTGGFGNGGGGGGSGGGGLNLFGLKTGGAGLAGTFYDLKQTTTHLSTNMTPDMYGKIMNDFANGGFNTSVLNRYFRSTKPLYASQIWIPNIPAEEGPSAFQLRGVVQPRMWLVHYRGTVTAPASFTFHFVGAGDDLMMVKFDGRLVLSRNWYVNTNWHPFANYDYGFSLIAQGFAKGNAIKVEAGRTYPMEVVIGEQPGGEMFATLLQEIQGENYEKDKKGNPILPVFRMTNARPAPSTASRPFPPHRDDGPVWPAQPIEPAAIPAS